MANRIALVDDDQNILTSVSLMLESEGFDVNCYNDGEAALQGLAHQPVDLAVLDIKMPRMDGVELLQKIRKNSQLPVIFLTSKDDELDEALGFGMGADDYITKPFELTELLLRIRAVIKRSKKQTKKGFNLGNTYFDCINYTLKGEKIKKLTKKEGDILNLLCASTGNVIKREVILNEIWGDDNYFNGRSLDVFITKLRKYLSEEKSVRIENIHGIGFCLKSS